MPLICEDLADYGVVLIPPSKTEYFDLLVDIEHRLRMRPKGSPPIDEETLSRISEHDRRSAILLNRSQLAIASLAYIWWFRGMHGRTVPHSSTPGSNASVLLPFGLDERAMKFNGFLEYDFLWLQAFDDR